MSGAETALEDLRILDAAMAPRWDPDFKVYKVMLDRKQDLVQFTFQRADNGQLVTLEAEREAVGAGLPSRGRRLWIGEKQRVPSTLTTTLDVGHTRMVHLHVSSAARTQKATYSFTVQRPPCPPDLPFFDGAGGVCTDICNDGHFGSKSTGRCAPCGQAHCAVCASAERCDLCLEGFASAGGGCRRAGGVVGGESAGGVEAALSGLPWMAVTGTLAVVALLAVAGTVVKYYARTPFRSKEKSLLEASDDELLLQGGGGHSGDDAYEGGSPYNGSPYSGSPYRR